MPKNKYKIIDQANTRKEFIKLRSLYFTSLVLFPPLFKIDNYITMEYKIIDCVIVGGGISGLSAGLFLGRANLSTIIFDTGNSRILSVNKVREYINFDNVKPEEMLANARNEVLRYGTEIRNERVIKIEHRTDSYFDIYTNSGKITSKTVVIATGLKDNLPKIKGLSEKWGNDIRVCPCFDGYEVLNKKYVVFGLPERLAHMASWVSIWSSDVTIVTNHTFNEFDSEKIELLGIKIEKGEVDGLVKENNKLIAVSTKNGKQIECDATWVAMNPESTSTLASTLCEVDEFGIAKTEYGGKTSRKGVFAIGNASNSWAHLAHAAAEGTTVGPVVTMFLLEQRLEQLRNKKLKK